MFAEKITLFLKKKKTFYISSVGLFYDKTLVPTLEPKKNYSSLNFANAVLSVTDSLILSIPVVWTLEVHRLEVGAGLLNMALSTSVFFIYYSQPQLNFVASVHAWFQMCIFIMKL